VAGDEARHDAIWDANMSEEGLCGREIFVVDDDPSVGETLSAILRRNGYEVTCFAEGQSFLAAARAREPACVLLDVNLPGQSGLDILKNLNGEHYPVPILMISGVGDIPMAVEAIKYGALDFIEKPFRASTVSAAVQAAIAAWTARRGDNVVNGVPTEFAGCKPLTKREAEVLAHHGQAWGQEYRRSCSHRHERKRQLVSFGRIFGSCRTSRSSSPRLQASAEQTC
jgi:FixJ family two-component response regulator